MDETEAYNHFQEFYADTVPELRQFGEIVQLKVCRNHAPHLGGNVYVQYRSDDDAMRAIRSLNGRFYAGRRISTELSPVTNWKTAICGLFDKNQCPRGRQCNFLHVFRNPNGEYDLQRDGERRGDERDRHDRDRERRSVDREHHRHGTEHRHSRSDREHAPREYYQHGDKERGRDEHAHRDREHHGHDGRAYQHHRKREREYDEHEHGERKKHKR